MGRAASLLGAIFGSLLACVVAVGLGFAAYFLSLPPSRTGEAATSTNGLFFLFFIFSVALLMWGMTPLALGGGGRFEPTRMMLYPISLGKLFIFDLVSDLTSLAAIFAVPSILAIGLGVGLANGAVMLGLLLSFGAIAFGMSLAKLLSVGVGALMRTKRTRGEMILALLGAALGMLGILMGQLLSLMERYAHYLEWTRWTPSGAAAFGLVHGLRPGGEMVYLASLLTLFAYASVCLWTAFLIARRTALGIGGRKRRARRKKSGVKPRARVGGLRIPFASVELGAIIEKELKYSLRNAQLRVIALMALGFIIVIRMAPVGGRGGGLAEMTPYAEGAGAVFSLLYIFTLMSPVSTNLFGYEGGGMRAFVLSPVERRLILFGKNAALTFATLLIATVGVLAGGLFFRDLSWGVLLFAALSFAIYAPLFSTFGNWLSMRYPKRVEFGKRMNRSGVAGLILVPFFMLLLLPPALAVLGAHLAESRVVLYAILALFALISIFYYRVSLERQARALEWCELEILEAVTTRDGGEGDAIMG